MSYNSYYFHRLYTLYMQSGHWCRFIHSIFSKTCAGEWLIHSCPQTTEILPSSTPVKSNGMLIHLPDVNLNLTWQWACSQRNESRSESHFGTWFWPFPDLKAWFLPFVNAKLFQIRLLKCKEKGVLDRDRPRKPDSEDLLNAKLFRNVIRACAFWKCALKPCMGQSAQ